MPRRSYYPTAGRRKRKKLRHFHLNPQPAEMLEAIRGYEVRGVRVLLGYPEMEVSGVIDRQRFGGMRAQFIVIFDSPISQEEYETALGMLRGQANAIWTQARTWGLRTDRGVVRAVDEEDRLVWFQGQWNYFSIDPEESPIGTLVHWEEPMMAQEAMASPALPGEKRVFSGRLAGMEQGTALRGGYTDIVLVELFEPVPYWLLPNYGVAKGYYALKPGLHSKLAYFVPTQWYRILSEQGLIGPGKELTEAPMVALEEPVEISEVMKRLHSTGWRAAPGEERQLMPGMPLYFIVPFEWPPSSNQWGLRPMRKEQAEGLELEVFEGAEWLEGLV